MADTLLGNAFEPLIDLSTTGGIAPGVAESWEINQASTEFVFHLREAWFSDGTPLKAQDFIRSWLEASTFESIDSANRNTLDVLYRIRGFSPAAAKIGKVEGLSSPDDRTLKVTFSKPFRTALFELSGTRYAAWKREPATGRFIGTGSYQITEHQPGILVRYAPNPHAVKKARYYSIEVQGFEDIWDHSISPSDYDLLMGQDPEGKIPSPFRQAPGSITGHSVLLVSGLPGSLFASLELRLAFQYLVLHGCLETLKNSPFFSVDLDPQIYPPLWPGRLNEVEIRPLIAEGEKHVAALVEKTRERPLRLRSKNSNARFLIERLKKLGLRFDDKSETPLRGKEFLAVAYGKSEYDVALVAANVVGADPDSIYHLLGEHGAIHSPPLTRREITALLEKGRDMKRTEDLDSFYQKVSREVLRQVPLIHLRFLRAAVYLNESRIQTESALNNSDRFSFNQLKNQFFQPSGIRP